MSNFESPAQHSADNVAASGSSADVIGEFASSAWKAGVARPLMGVGQLVDSAVQMEPEKNLTGAMRVANIAGSAAGTLADIVILSGAVGKGVTAIAEGVGAKALLENGMTRSMTVAGSTGFIDGFAFNPQQRGETVANRLAHGVAEGAGFMALDGTTRILGSKAVSHFAGKLRDSEVAGALVRFSDTTGKGLTENAPAWASEAGKNAAAFLGRTGEKVGDSITKRFPNLTPEAMTRNAVAGLVGGHVAGSADAVLNNREPDLSAIDSTALGWAAANALLGPRVGGRSVETKSFETRAPEPKPENTETAAKAPDVAPPKPSFTPETSILENGDQQWTYRDVPNKGDSTVYTKDAGSLLNWEIKTADGQVYNRTTKGPWEINYPDGTTLAKNESNYLSFTKPIEVELAGKPISVKEVTQLTGDQTPIAKQWVYEDPAVQGQVVTLNANRTWEAEGADGKIFDGRSKGPWQVTTLDGFVETRGQSGETNVQRAEGTSNWLDLHGVLPGDGVARTPRAIRISAEDTSPMSLSDAPRHVELSKDAPIT